MGLNTIPGVNVLLRIVCFDIRDNEQIVFSTCHVIPKCIICMELGIIRDYSYTFFCRFYAFVTRLTRHHFAKKKKPQTKPAAIYLAEPVTV